MPRINLDNYVQVDVRILKFWEKYPDGAIITELLHADDRVVRFKAACFKDSAHVPNMPIGIGHAEEYRITEQQIKNNPKMRDLPNATSAVENCETSAVGRALAMAGFEVTKGVASRAEMEKVERQRVAREGSSKVGVDKPPTPAKVETSNGADAKLSKDEALAVAGRIKGTGMEIPAIKLKLTAMGIETAGTLANTLETMNHSQASELEEWVINQEAANDERQTAKA